MKVTTLVSLFFSLALSLPTENPQQGHTLSTFGQTIEMDAEVYNDILIEVQREYTRAFYQCRNDRPDGPDCEPSQVSKYFSADTVDTMEAFRFVWDVEQPQDVEPRDKGQADRTIPAPDPTETPKSVRPPIPECIKACIQLKEKQCEHLKSTEKSTCDRRAIRKSCVRDCWAGEN